MAGADDDQDNLRWNDLLQELRVAQTGVQILAGFLLTLPFTDRFADLSDGYRTLYLCVFGGAVLTIGLIIMPVACHRLLFGWEAKDVLLKVGNPAAKAGLAALGLTLSATVLLIFGVVVSTPTGLVAGGVVLAFFALVWIALPLRLRAHPQT